MGEDTGHFAHVARVLPRIISRPLPHVYLQTTAPMPIPTSVPTRRLRLGLRALTVLIPCMHSIHPACQGTAPRVLGFVSSRRMETSSYLTQDLQPTVCSHEVRVWSKDTLVYERQCIDKPATHCSSLRPSTAVEGDGAAIQMVGLSLILLTDGIPRHGHG